MNVAVATIGLPAVAAVLRDAHYPVIADGDDGFETAAIEIRRAREQGRLAGCIVADVPRRSLEAWIAKQAKMGMPTVLVTGVATPDAALVDLGVSEIDLPATVAELLGAIGVDAEQLDHLIVVADGANGVAVRDRDPSTVSVPPVDVLAAPVAPSPFCGATGAPSTELAVVDRPLPPPTTAGPVSTARPVVDDQLEEWLSKPTDAHRSEQERRRRAACTVFVVAGKGGVGKTSLAFNLAQYGAASGLSAAAIDMNRGQSDLAGYLKAGFLKARGDQPKPLPTIVDAAARRPVTIDAALVSPDMLNRARQVNGADQVRFHAVFGPRGEANADPKVAGDDVYRAIIRQSAQRFDVTVVDTQTIEATDTSALIDGVLAPMVADRDAWLLGVMDSSSVSVANLYRRFEALVHRGATPDRLMVIFNRQGAPGEASFDLERATNAFNGLATVVGRIPFDWAIGRAGNSGGFISDHAAAAPVLRAVLSRVTGLAAFDPIEDATINGHRRLWNWLRRR